MGYFNDIKAFAYQYLLGKVSTYGYKNVGGPIHCINIY